MGKIKKIPTCDIPDGYYAHHWSREGVILRDKVNEILDALDEQEDEDIIIVVNSDNETEWKKKYQRLEKISDSMIEEYRKVIDRNLKAIDFIDMFKDKDGTMHFPFDKIKDILMGEK